MVFGYTQLILVYVHYIGEPTYYCTSHSSAFRITFCVPIKCLCNIEFPMRAKLASSFSGKAVSAVLGISLSLNCVRST